LQDAEPGASPPVVLAADGFVRSIADSFLDILSNNRVLLLLLMLSVFLDQAIIVICSHLFGVAILLPAFDT
jgi:hypothetical protein